MTSSSLTFSLSLAVVLLSLAQLVTFHHHLRDGHYYDNNGSSSSFFVFQSSSSSAAGTTAAAAAETTAVAGLLSWSSPIIATADRAAQKVLEYIAFSLGFLGKNNNSAARTTSYSGASDHHLNSTSMVSEKRELIHRNNNDTTTTQQRQEQQKQQDTVIVQPPSRGMNITSSTEDDEQHKNQTIVDSPPGSTDSCSCWNPKYSNCQPKDWKCVECCRRTINVNHKMGVIMTKRLLVMRVLTGLARQDLFPPHYHDKKYFDPSNRFRRRSVLIVRNLVDTLVSGYLYHKSGQECWLDGFGKKPPNNEGTMHNVPWDKLMGKNESYQFTIPWKRTKPTVPVRKRDICEYLSQESEEIGMAAYADFAMGYWYAVNYEFYKLVRRHEDPQSYPKTMFVCYEDLSTDASTKERTVRKIMRFLHPIGNYRMNLDPIQQQKKKEKERQQGQPHALYAGSHATDPDPELRNRLRGIVQTLDRDVFGHFIRQTDEAYGCGRKNIQLAKQIA